MKTKLSAIALGIGLTLASQFAMAQTPSGTVTLSQQGTGNTAAAEQSGFASDATFTVQITQIGNNNHVGGPGGTTDGIVQSGGNSGAATVTQTGNGNNAGIVQSLSFIPLSTVTITQTGNTNSAVARQANSGGVDIYVTQNGTGNVASVDQTAADTAIHVTQSGTNNNATVVDQGTGITIGPQFVQTGEGNTVSATINGGGFTSDTVTQSGLRNQAVSNQFNVYDSILSIQQLGADNQANIDQAGDRQSATINQNGNGNQGSIVQAGVTGTLVGNTALITQVGNSNNATIRQVGDGFASTVSQIGAGNYANVYQH